MNSETAAPSRIGQPIGPTSHFTMRFSSTPRGARLARRLARQRLDAWGIPYDCGTHHTLTLIVAEFAANADRHGRISGRDFEGAALELERHGDVGGTTAQDRDRWGHPVAGEPSDQAAEVLVRVRHGGGL